MQSCLSKKYSQIFSIRVTMGNKTSDWTDIFCRSMLMDGLQGSLKMVMLHSIFIELFELNLLSNVNMNIFYQPGYPP